MSLVEANPIIEVRQSKLHGNGLFAACSIRAGSLIVEYVGERISKEEGQRRAAEQLSRARTTGEGQVYLFELDAEYDLDGSAGANVARYANHSCEPNCEMQNLNGHLWLVAQREIKAGEELTFDYGYDMTGYFEHPCHCGQRGCCGYIVRADLRWKVRRLVAQGKRRPIAAGVSGKSPV